MSCYENAGNVPFEMMALPVMNVREEDTGS